MAKYYGKVGYETTSEDAHRPGVWTSTMTDKFYPMDIYRNSRSLQGTSERNDSINVSMTASIVADPFAYENFHAIRYVEYLNSKWRVTNIEVEYPRLKLTLGGLYHAEVKDRST